MWNQVKRNTSEQVAINMCDFDSVQKGNYFGREPIRRTEAEVRVGTERLYVRIESLGGIDMVLHWVWRLSNMTFENGIVPED